MSLPAVAPTGSVHPAAAVFPMLPNDELEALAESIADVGLLSPIVLTPDGDVLDGRNRLAACELAEVEPSYVVHDGDPVAFVAACNVNRRHMMTGARAMAVAQMLADAGRRGGGKWEYGAVPDDGERCKSATWQGAMARAGAVIDHAPDLAPLVIAGSQTLHAAHEEATTRRDASQSEQSRMDRLSDGAPDLAAQVTEERLTLSEAEASWRQRESDNDRDRRAAVSAAWEITNSLKANAVTVSGGISLGEPIDVDELIHEVEKVLDFLKNMPRET